MDFVQDICQNKGEVYIVGGAIRNLLFNKIHGTSLTIHDRDILVRNLELNKLKDILRKHGTIKEVGQAFGIIKFNHQIDNISYDIAMPRTEVSTGPGYRDFKIVTDHQLELIEDFKRRDATFNSMGYRVYDYQDLLIDKITGDLDHFVKSFLVDPYNGLEDIRLKIYRATGDPTKRFIEDPTRIMRAIRQTAELELTLDSLTKKSIIDNYQLLKEPIRSSVVRITEELVRILTVNYRHVLQFLFDSQIATLLELPPLSLYVNKCTKENSNLRILVALLLSASDNKNAVAWTRKYELSAANHFPKQDTAFISCVNKLYPMITANMTDLSMKRLIQETERLFPNFGLSFSYDLIRYYKILTDHDLMNLYQSNKDCILSVNHVVLDGTIIQNLFMITGKKLGQLKTLLFNAITEDKVKNTEQDLIDYIHSIQF